MQSCKLAGDISATTTGERVDFYPHPFLWNFIPKPMGVCYNIKRWLCISFADFLHLFVHFSSHNLRNSCFSNQRNHFCTRGLTQITWLPWNARDAVHNIRESGCTGWDKGARSIFGCLFIHQTEVGPGGVKIIKKLCLSRVLVGKLLIRSLQDQWFQSSEGTNVSNARLPIAAQLEIRSWEKFSYSRQQQQQQVWISGCASSMNKTTDNCYQLWTEQGGPGKTFPSRTTANHCGP